MVERNYAQELVDTIYNKSGASISTLIVGPVNQGSLDIAKSNRLSDLHRDLLIIQKVLTDKVLNNREFKEFFFLSAFPGILIPSAPKDQPAILLYIFPQDFIGIERGSLLISIGIVEPGELNYKVRESMKQVLQQS